MKDEEKRIEEMAKDIVRSSSLDVYQKAEYLIGLGYTKIDYKNLDNIDLMIFGGKRFEYIPKDRVVLSREEYEMLANQYKNLEIKYSNLCDNYRLCKDANETLKQKVIITRKEIAEKFYDKVNENICVFQLENKNQEFTDGYAQAIADICDRLDQVAKQFGVEINE